MDDARAAAIVKDVAPVYYITGTIHSTESGAPTALMELAYRLAVDESPYMKHIRDNVITLITPIVEVDGRDRDGGRVQKWHMAHPSETYPNLLYWGKYVAHDNNRDAMALTLKLSQNVLNAYVGWKAQVLHDLHESGVVPLRQHHRRRSLQRVARPARSRTNGSSSAGTTCRR